MKDYGNENSEKECEGPGDGQTSIDCRVPVHRMLISYRVPGFLEVEMMAKGEVRQRTWKSAG